MMSNLSEQSFNYDELDEDTRVLVLHKTYEIHGLMRRTAEEIILIGENLLAVKEHLPETKFSAWLRAEFSLSRQSAYNFMRVASKLGGSCKTVLQLPATVLYELASSSEEIIEQVETGALSPTIEAIRVAREAERQAREGEQQAEISAKYAQERLHSLQEEIEAQQALLARLKEYREESRQQSVDRSRTASDEEKVPIIPHLFHERLESLAEQVSAITQQRDALAQQVTLLQQQAQAEAFEQEEETQAKQTRLHWSHITTEFQRSVRTLLSQWPSPLDSLVFEADDWTRLSQTRETASRLLEECRRLGEGGERLVVESIPPASR